MRGRGPRCSEYFSSLFRNQKQIWRSARYGSSSVVERILELNELPRIHTFVQNILLEERAHQPNIPILSQRQPRSSSDGLHRNLCGLLPVSGHWKSYRRHLVQREIGQLKNQEKFKMLPWMFLSTTLWIVDDQVVGQVKESKIWKTPKVGCKPSELGRIGE